MMKYVLSKKQFYRIAFGVFFCMVLLLARDTMITLTLLGFYLAQGIMIGLVCACGIAFLVYNRTNLKKIFSDYRIIIMGVFSVVILVPMLVKFDFQLMYCSVLFCIGFAVLLTYFIRMEEVGRYFVLLMTALALYSLIGTYLLKGLVETGTLHAPRFVNSAGTSFWNLGLVYVVDQPQYYRNFGIFREPGVYQFFIMLALFLNNCIISWRPQVQWTCNGILAVTMLSTFSTNGVIELGLFAILFFVDKECYKDKRARMVAIGLLSSIVVVLIPSFVKKDGIYRSIYSMVGKLFTLTHSSAARIESVEANLALFIRSPMVGCDLDTVFGAVKHNTTSSLLMFSIFGICGGLLSFVGWVAFVWNRKRRTLINIGYLIVFLMSFNTQNIIADIFFWLFPIMALVDRILPYLEKRKIKHGKQLGAFFKRSLKME